MKGDDNQEINNDDEYLILVLSMYIQEMISFCYYNECRIQEVEFKNRFTESFIKLCGVNDYYSFSNMVCTEAKNLFLSNNCKFIYCHEDKLIIYTGSDSG